MKQFPLHGATKLFALGVFSLASAVTIFSPAYLVGLLTLVAIESIAVLGLTLLLITGLVSLGHAAYVGIGAYSAALLVLHLGISPFPAIVFGIVISTLAGLVIGGVTLRLKGIFLPLATLAMGVAIPAAIVAWAPVTGGASGLSGIPDIRLPFQESVPPQKMFAVLVWAVLCLLAFSFARTMHSRTGRAVAAVANNADLASVFGIGVFRIRLLMVGVASALAGLSGALYAFHYNFLSAAPFSLSASIGLLIAAVIGGSVHPYGAIIGVLVVTFLEIALQNTVARGLGYSGAVEMIFFGMLLVAVLIRWPGGVWSIISRLWPTFDPGRFRAGASLEGSLTTHKAQAENAGDPILSLRGVDKNFGGLKALSDVDLELSSGEMVGLIGPNGAGKSTIFNLVCGLARTSGGSIAVMGRDPKGNLSWLVRAGVARTFQHVKVIPDLTVVENIALGVHSRARSGLLHALLGLDRREEREIMAAALDAAERTGLRDLVQAKASSLAMGQLRLLEVARALAAKPNILMLDEPAAGLRAGEKRKLSRLLRNLRGEGISMLLVEHDMDFVMNTVDRIFVLDRGRNLAVGSPEEIKSNPAVISAYLGT